MQYHNVVVEITELIMFKEIDCQPLRQSEIGNRLILNDVSYVIPVTIFASLVTKTEIRGKGCFHHSGKENFVTPYR